MLPIAILSRSYSESHTLGTLSLPSGTQIKTIELPWRDNLANRSCFPGGLYRVNWLNRSASGKYTRVWHVQDVPGRSGILIHAGNVLSHTRGCTLVGMRHGAIAGQVAVLDSVKALNIMRKELGGKNFFLIVI